MLSIFDNMVLKPLEPGWLFLKNGSITWLRSGD